MQIAAIASPSYPGSAPSVLEGMSKLVVSGAVDLLGAVLSEAVDFGFVSEQMKTELKGVVRVEVGHPACDVSDIVVNFSVICGDIVMLVPELEGDLTLLGTKLAKGKLEELERVDVVVLQMSVSK